VVGDDRDIDFDDDDEEGRSMQRDQIIIDLA
jgi:hypothetical protein